MSHILFFAEISQYYMAVPLAVALLLLAQAAWRKQKLDAARAKTEAQPSPALSVRSQEAEPPMDLVRWQVEMHDLSRELRATLDSKLVLLERLVREARHEADRLERAMEHARQAGPREPANRI